MEKSDVDEISEQLKHIQNPIIRLRVLADLLIVSETEKLRDRVESVSNIIKIKRGLHG